MKPSMPQDSEPDFDPLPAARRALWQRAGCISVFGVLLTIPLLWAVFYGMGIVAGKEFSPNTFETRKFRYMRNPFTGNALSKRTLFDESPALGGSLIDEGWIAPKEESSPRWDLVSDNWQVENSADFDAAILVAYLEFVDGEGEYIWQLWSLEQPERAKIFWPVVARFAYEGIYIPLPDLFRWVQDFRPGRSTVGGELFEKELKSLAARLAAEHAQRELKAGRNDQAAAAAEIAIDYDPKIDVKTILQKTGKTGS